MLNVAAVYMKTKDWAKCVEYSSKALTSDPEDKTQLKWKAMYRRGVALKHLKRYPQAAAELTIALKLKPNYAKAKKHLESIRKLMKPPAPPLKTIKGLTERKVGINEFEIREDLGEGNFSNVVKVTHKTTKESFALKSIEIKKVKRLRIRHPNIDNEIMMEKSVLSKLKHPGVIEMYHTFKDALNLYFLLEYVTRSILIIVLSKTHRNSNSNIYKHSGTVREVRCGVNSRWEMRWWECQIRWQDVTPHKL